MKKRLTALHLKLFFLALAGVLSVNLAYGQYYSTGQDAAGISWRQIQTPHFKLIYPSNFEANAQRLAYTVEQYYLPVSSSLNFNPKPIPIILHTQNIDANALTIWAPKRIEMFTCPPQDIYAHAWLDQLVVHEFRHGVQFSRSQQGITKILSWLGGEQVTAGLTGLLVPTWFIEGDAVCAETALSRSGRGRIPYFEMFLRTQVMQKGIFNYNKAVFGSYKDFVANQYVLGYPLVANVVRKYSYKAWNNALDKVARQPYLITPFSRGLKQTTGQSKVQLYKSTLHELDSMWQKQQIKTFLTTFNRVSPVSSKKYIHYKYPFFINDSTLLTLTTGMDDIARFAIIQKGKKTEKIFTPGFFTSELYSYTSQNGNNGKMVWAEKTTDPRWDNRNYSVIKIYNLSTKEVKQLTRRSRYFAPSLSPDGLQIAAIKVDEDNTCSIVLLNAENGKEEAVLLKSNTEFYMTPSWNDNGKQIVFISMDDNGKSIQTIEAYGNHQKIKLPSTFTEISEPAFARKYILFNGSYSGIENIYAVDTLTGKVWQVTSSAFGARSAHVNNGGTQITYADYTANGYAAVTASFNPDNWPPLETITDHSPQLYKYLPTGNENTVNEPVVLQQKWESKPYKKAAHLFKFHSWAPVYYNYTENDYGLGASLMSQNLLSTATTFLGYKYDYAEKAGRYYGRFEWAGWYPKICFDASYANRNAAYTPKDGKPINYTFNETTASAGVSLPLFFINGKYYQGLNISVNNSWINIFNNTSPNPNKLTGTISSLDYSFIFYNYLKQSVKDMYPQWGQAFIAKFRHSPLGDNNLGSIAALEARLFFPGIVKHHSIRVDLRYQNRVEGDYKYSNLIIYPRGYANLSYNTLKIVSLNYKLPLLYPDWSLGSIMYVKRLKSNFFMDYAEGSSKTIFATMQSVGAELTADLHLFRFLYPFEIGARVGYKPHEQKWFNQVIFSVNLNN